MKQDIDNVMAARQVAEKLPVYCMAQPRNGMPVMSVSSGGECPADTVPIQAGFYIGIIAYVKIIVVLDKIVSIHRQIYRYNRRRKTDTYQ
jgi:hypothetical protein